MENQTHNPHLEYTQRLAARCAALAAEQQRSDDFWLRRRIVFGAGALLVLLAFNDLLPPWILALPVVVFIALMVAHQRVQTACRLGVRAVSFYERGLARLEDRWAGGGETGARFADPAHPYAEDLDLFGAGSLFELLSTARTRAGEDRLAAWLRAPAPIADVRARQAAVDELRPRLDLREDLSLLGDDAGAGLHPAVLAAWGAAIPVFTSRWLPLVAALLGVLALASVVLWFVYGWRNLAFAALIAESFLLLRTRARVAQVIGEVEQPSRDLKLLSQLLARLEAERFTTPRLTALRAALDTDGVPPSEQIARLHNLIEILDWTKNQFFAPVAALLLLHVHIACAIDRWRLRSGAAIARWLDAVGEIEALNSLAGYAWEHPADPFPELPDLAAGTALFDGAEIGHPLLPEARCVRNDVRLDGERQVLIVSGSNMSGKSTLMRTVGVNVVLALAGAPVRARSLRLSPLAVGASIHILDSLQSGASRFYAEITRLKQIVELTNGALPLLFLLDEILSGTNSHDRRIGSEAVVKGLVARGAVGFVTTHDLALTKMAETLGGRAVNVHFEDQLAAGRMVFDYRMKPGVVTHSNALELMRSVGLEV